MLATQAAKSIIEYFNTEPVWHPGESASDIPEIAKIVQLAIDSSRLDANSPAELAATLRRELSPEDLTEMVRELLEKTESEG